MKETAFSGVFPLVTELESRGAVVTVHDPLYTDEGLAQLGLDAHNLGAEVDAVVVQTDHAEYASLTSDDVPGARVVIDGRLSVDPTLLEARVHVIGQAL